MRFSWAPIGMVRNGLAKPHGRTRESQSVWKND